jgi:hypothetical protein
VRDRPLLPIVSTSHSVCRLQVARVVNHVQGVDGSVLVQATVAAGPKLDPVIFVEMPCKNMKNFVSLVYIYLVAKY